MVREPTMDCRPQRNCQRQGCQIGAVAALLKLAELMPPAPNGPLGVSEPAKANPLD